MTKSELAKLSKHETVAIIGSRAYSNLEYVRLYVRGLSKDTTVVSGGARGVDKVAESEARKCGLNVISIPAEWDKYGKSAGFRRNHDIIAQADRVVAFWDGTSKGAKHFIDIAQKQGKPVIIFELDVYLKLCNRNKQVSTGKQIKLIKRRTRRQ